MAQSIGFFQFDNLVKGRVPFLFVNLNIDTNALYPHIYKMHLDRMLLTIPDQDLAAMEAAKIVSFIQDQKHPSHQAIVLLCENGEKSELIAHTLEGAGYVNVFVVAGGWLQLLEEQQNSNTY